MSDTPTRDLCREISVMLGEEQSLVGYSPEVAHLRYLQEMNDDLGCALELALFKLAKLGDATAKRDMELLGINMHESSTLVLPKKGQVLQ